MNEGFTDKSKRGNKSECDHKGTEFRIIGSILLSVSLGSREESDGRIDRTDGCYIIVKVGNDRLVKKLPSDGTRVRVRTVRKFITAIEVLP